MAQQRTAHRRMARGASTSYVDGVTFATNLDGLEKVLGVLEAAIMRTLWRSGRQLPVSTIMAHVGTVLGQYRTISTIQTTLNRLSEKGFLCRTPVAGTRGTQGYIYQALIDEPTFRRYVAEQLALGIADFPGLEYFERALVNVRGET